MTISLERYWINGVVIQEIKNIEVKIYYKKVNRESKTIIYHNFVIYTFKINSFELTKLIKQISRESNVKN